MKITLEENGEAFTYDSGHDCSMHMSELTEKLYGLCIAAGYHPNSVSECFYDKGKEATEHLLSEGNTALLEANEPFVVKSQHGDKRALTIINNNERNNHE